MRLTQVLLVTLVVLVFAGCGKRTVTYRFEIKSNVSWSASYKPVTEGHATDVEGSGDQTIMVYDSPPVCIIVDGDGPGYLEVTAYKHVSTSGNPLRSDDEVDIAQDTDSTEDPSGEVGVCTQ